MRLIALLPLFMAAACDVQKDTQNDRTTIELNEAAVQTKAESLGNSAEEVISDVGNAAEQAGPSIEKGVRDVDIDVDIDRDRSHKGK
jgi:formiminotetrahydrofolate cyclodeaminase